MGTSIDDIKLISHKNHKLFLGYLGLWLPVLLIVGNRIIYDISELSGSISAYYHSDMGDIFVGTMFAFGVFLLTYKGYELIDSFLGFIAAVLAINVALFPTDKVGEDTLIGIVHLISAFTFYFILAIYSICLFRRRQKHALQDAGDGELPSLIDRFISGFQFIWNCLFGRIDFKSPDNPAKNTRNGIYLWMGRMMMISLGIILLFSGLDWIGQTINPWNDYRGLLFFELVLNATFSFAWIVKGGGVHWVNDLEDREARDWEWWKSALYLINLIGIIAGHIYIIFEIITT